LMFFDSILSWKSF